METRQTAPAHLTLHTQTTSIPGAQATFYDLTVENHSGVVWDQVDPHPVRLSYHWLSDRDEPVIYDCERTPLPGPVGAGESCRVHLRVHPPPFPGRYILAIDIVHEGVGWFNLDCRLSVECLPVTQPRAVLVNHNCMAHNAIGNNIVRKLRLLRKWGYAPLLLVGDFDDRLPLDDQALMIEVGTTHILNPSLDLQWVAKHFWQASLYIFDYPEYYALIELIRIVPRGPVLFDYHGVTPPELWTSTIARENMELGVQNLNLVSYADYAITHSEHTRAELIRTGAITPERVTLIPLTVAINTFRPNAHKPAITSLDLNSGPVLLYVGRMAGNKRIDLLIRMTALVKERYPDVRLLLVGDHEALVYEEVVTEAYRLITALDLTDNVSFTGQVHDDVLVAYYQAADLFVTASLHEGFCIPVIEAMACGKPVVATAATALPSTVGDGGLLFEPENVQMLTAQVLKLLDSRFQDSVDGSMDPHSLYQTLSQRARRRALEFTEDHYEERLRDLLDRATQPAAPANAYAALQALLRDLARTARPNYQIQSRLPIVGRLIAWLRRTMTSHLREPYLDPILAQQERFNFAIHEQVAELTQLVWRLAQQDTAHTLRAQQAQIAELQARIAQIEARLAGQTVVVPGEADELKISD